MSLAINLSTFIDAGYTGDVIRWDLYETGSGVFIDSHTEPGPHGTVYNFSFVNNIRDLVYTVKLYNVPPGASVGNLIKAHDLTVSTSTIKMDAPIEIIVGRGTPVDPDANSTSSPAIPALIGRTGSLIKRSYGPLLQTREAEFALDNTTGVISLLNGLQFDDADVYFFDIDILYVVNPPGSSNSGLYSGVELVTTDRTIIASDMGKLFLVQQGSAVITLQLPSYAALPADIPLTIHNIGDNSAAVNLVIQTFGGEGIMQGGVNLQKFIFSRGDKGYIIRHGSQLYGSNENIESRYRGMVVFDNILRVNRRYADGTKYNAADFPGVVQALASAPIGSIRTSFNDWNASRNEPIYTKLDKNNSLNTVGVRTVYYNRGYFGLWTESGVAKIQFPDWRGMYVRAMKNIGGGDSQRSFNMPGSFQASSFVQHSLLITLGKGGGIDTNPNGGALIAPNTNPDDFASHDVFGGGGPYVDGTETRTDNIGQMAVVII